MNNGFSPRELEIIKLISEGYSGKQISLSLGISLATVQRNIDNITERYELANRAHIVSYCMRKGIIV